MAMPYSVVNGARTYYEVAGEGPAMVLLHAIPFDLTLWHYQITHFSARFRVIAVDFRAHGRSDAVTTPYHITDLAQDVMAVSRAEGIESAVLAGISIGSRIALQMVLDYPGSFSAVVLVGSGAKPSGSMGRRIAEYGALDGDAEAFVAYRRAHLEFGVSAAFAKSARGRYLIDSYAERSGCTRPAAMVELFKAFGHVDLTGRLGEIEIPALVVNGEHDNALPSGRWTAERIAGGIHAVVPGTGHACNIEDPATFDRLVTDFLGRHGLLPGL
jgi:pimeloyl-ACP methyl ester carboxylesterase